MNPTTPATPAAPAPTNGVKPQTPTAPATPAPPPDATAAELKTWQERATKAEALAQQKSREEIINRRKWEGEKKTFGEKLKAADEYERLKREARVNPKSAAEKLWGEKYLEHLNTVAANGNAPTAESIAFDNEQREERFRKELDDRDQKRADAAQQANQRHLDAQLRAFSAAAGEYAKESVKDYPVFEQLGSPERIGGLLVSRIREVHDATIKRDPETNEVLQPGRVMSFKEAAEALETDLISIAERAADSPKYQDKLRAKLTPAKTPSTFPPVKSSQVSSQVSSQGSQSSPPSSSQPRRTLGNDLTGSTPGDPPKYRTEQQRMSDALAKYEASRKK